MQRKKLSYMSRVWTRARSCDHLSLGPSQNLGSSSWSGQERSTAAFKGRLVCVSEVNPTTRIRSGVCGCVTLCVFTFKCLWMWQAISNMSSSWAASISCLRRDKARTDGCTGGQTEEQERRNLRCFARLETGNRSRADLRQLLPQWPLAWAVNSYLGFREGDPAEAGFELGLQLLQNQQVLPVQRQAAQLSTLF